MPVIFFLLCGTPFVVFTIMAFAGWAEPWAALGGAIVTEAVGLAVAMAWARDADMMTAAGPTHRRGRCDPSVAPAPQVVAPLVMAPFVMERLGREIERLSRRLSTLGGACRAAPPGRFADPGAAA